MSELAALAFIDALFNVGHYRLTKRLNRRIRYRWLYPWAGRYLFPMQTLKDDGLPKSFSLQAFHEDAAALSIFPQRLLQEAENVGNHRFAFLNLTPIDLGNPVNWHAAPKNDPLWQENLHYCEWALTLAHAFAVTKETRFRNELIYLLTDWIDHNPVGQGVGWGPYPISRRLIVWSRVGITLWEDNTWQTFWQKTLAPSLYQQIRVLAANLEKDLANNHLLANYRALAWMGLIFPSWPEARHWRNVGLAGLWEEMHHQVLPDGVHDERSVSYHTIVLQDLLETWWLLRHSSEPIPEDVEGTITKMVQFLADIQTPDGSWPMINDSVPGYPTDPQDVLLAAGVVCGEKKWLAKGNGGSSSYMAWLTGGTLPDKLDVQREIKRAAVFPKAGYVVLHDDARDYLLFDAGPMGPDHLPGHGHADALSFVLYGEGKPLIVDPGVFSYHDKQWRDHFRSTAAHNTVTIDGQDQCIFWGAFRVAYPPKARLLEWSEDHVVGEHEGYCRLRQPVLHRRCIKKIGLDEWELFDHFEGKGEHDFALALQFAPGARAEINGLNSEIRWSDNVSLRVTCPSPPPRAVARIEQGWVSPGWNLKDEASRYVLQWRAKVPVENRVILKISTER